MDLKLNRLIRNKKGIVFTVIAILLSIFFTIMFSARIEKPLDYKAEIIETRINILNEYIDNFFNYAESAASISGYSALQGVIADMGNSTPAVKPRYYNATPNEFESNYTYCIKTGYLTGSKICPGMSNKTFAYYLDKISNITLKELNINSTYNINRINVTQTTDAFAIDLVINLSLKIIDQYANLSDTRIITSTVSIQGLLDPVYMLNGTYNQTINKTALPDKSGAWNFTDLQQLYSNHHYRRYYGGMSFINRIKGNFSISNSSYGIESFVNHTSPLVVYDVNDTMVDYLFWQKVKFKCNDNATLTMINDTTIISPVGFQIDETHRNIFNISTEDTAFTCPQ